MLRRSLTNMRVHVPTSFQRGSGLDEGGILTGKMDDLQRRLNVLNEKRQGLDRKIGVGNDDLSKHEFVRNVGNWTYTQIVERKENELDRYKREFLEERAKEEAFYLTPEGKEEGEREYKERADRKAYYEDFEKKHAKEINASRGRKKTVAKAEAKTRAPAKAKTGLSKWQEHLKAYREANPGISYKQAQKDAKASYVKATPEKKARPEKKQVVEKKHEKEEEDEVVPVAKGVSKWNAHLKAYKLANPGITHRQAQKDAKASYVKATPAKKARQEKKQEKKEEREAKAEAKAEANADIEFTPQIDKKQYLIKNFPGIRGIREMKLSDFLYEYKNETGLSGIQDDELIKYWNDNREKVLDFMSLDVFNYDQYRAKMRTLWYPLMNNREKKKTEKKTKAKAEAKAEKPTLAQLEKELSKLVVEDTKKPTLAQLEKELTKLVAKVEAKEKANAEKPTLAQLEKELTKLVVADMKKNPLSFLEILEETKAEAKALRESKGIIETKEEQKEREKAEAFISGLASTRQRKTKGPQKAYKKAESKAEAKAKEKEAKAEARAEAKAKANALYLAEKEKEAQKEAESIKRYRLQEEERKERRVMNFLKNSKGIGPSPAEEKAEKKQKQKTVLSELSEKMVENSKEKGEPGDLDQPPPDRTPRNTNFSKLYKKGGEHKAIVDEWDTNHLTLIIYQSPLRKNIEKFVEEKNRKGHSVIDANFDFFIRIVGDDVIEKYGVDSYIKGLRDIAQSFHIKHYAQTFGTQPITLLGKNLTTRSKELIALRNIELYTSIGKKLNRKLNALTKKWIDDTEYDADEEPDDDDYDPFYT